MPAIENFKIVKAQESDISALTDLYSQLDSEDKLSIREAIQIFNKLKQYPDFSVYVARINDKIVGAFELLIMDNFAHNGAKSGIVEDLIVDKSMRSRGIGSTMMKYAIDLCRKNKCYKLVLSSNIKREKAHEFYEKLGFIKHGYSFTIEL
jgi:GNAT superfamily N-acetyltransferase